MKLAKNSEFIQTILVPDASLPISRPTEKLSHSCSSQLGVNYATTTNTNIEIPPEEILEKTVEKYQIPESEKYRVWVRGQFCSGGST